MKVTYRKKFLKDKRLQNEECCLKFNLKTKK